jgi:pimeloyl-ACP methyl ester carboxylesterase
VFAVSDRYGKPIAAPSLINTVLESRAAMELGAFLAAAPLLRLLGRGDRHPVLVLPGFTATDRSTEPLRWLLRGQGYMTHGWGLGRNLGPTDRIVDGIHTRLTKLNERHGRKITVIGWSLGGIYARELGRDLPDVVRQVITLGSPFRMDTNDKTPVSRLFDSLNPAVRDDVLHIASTEDERPPLTMPSTAIYTRTDGIVRWHTCIDTVREQHENIEVLSSHSGLGWNPASLFAVLDRLQQPEGDWRPFQAPLLLRAFYPRPETWTPAASSAAAPRSSSTKPHDPAKVRPFKPAAKPKPGRDGLRMVS